MIIIICIKSMTMKTSIPIQKETKERLSRLGNLKSTYDSVINELVEHVEQCDKYWEDKP